MKNLCNDVNSNTGRVGSIITSLGGLTFGISGDVYGYYKNGQLVGFKSQADIDAAYQSGYNAGVAAGVTNHTGTYNITTNGTTDLGVHHTYRYINTIVPASSNIIGIVYNTASLYGTVLSTSLAMVAINFLDQLLEDGYVRNAVNYVYGQREDTSYSYATVGISNYRVSPIYSVTVTIRSNSSNGMISLYNASSLPVYYIIYNANGDNIIKEKTGIPAGQTVYYYPDSFGIRAAIYLLKS